MDQAQMVIASTAEERKEVFRTFIETDEHMTMLVIGNDLSHVTQPILSLIEQQLVMTDVVIHCQSNWKGILYKTYVQENRGILKTIYYRHGLDEFSKALIREYSPLVAFF
jgi:hypothetical protein